MKQNIVFIATVLFIIIIYGLTIKAIPGTINLSVKKTAETIADKPPFESSLERGRFAQMESISRGHLYVNNYIDFVKPDLAWFNGNYFPAFPPGVAVLSTPLFVLFEKIHQDVLGATLTTTLVTLLSTVILYKVLRMLGINNYLACFGMIVYAFGSSLFPYSVSISAHPFSSLSLIAVIWLSLKVLRDENAFWCMFTQYFILGINLFIDYPNVALLLLVVVVVTWRQGSLFSNQVRTISISLQMRSVAAMAGLVVPLLLFIITNVSFYGKPIFFTNTYNLRALDVQGISYDATHLTPAIFKNSKYASRFSPARLLRGIYVLLASSDRGLFMYYPLFIISLLGLFFLVKKNRYLAFLLLSTILLNLLIYGSFDDPWGGWSFGPRYLIISMPVFTILAILGIHYLLSRSYSWGPLLLILTYYGFYVALAGALTTNAVPPSVEPISKAVGSDYSYNLRLIRSGEISSLFYKLFGKNVFGPVNFQMGLLFGLILFSTFLLIGYIYNKTNDN